MHTKKKERGKERKKKKHPGKDNAFAISPKIEVNILHLPCLIQLLLAYNYGYDKINYREWMMSPRNWFHIEGFLPTKNKFFLVANFFWEENSLAVWCLLTFMCACTWVCVCQRDWQSWLKNFTVPFYKITVPIISNYSATALSVLRFRLAVCAHTYITYVRCVDFIGNCQMIPIHDNPTTCRERGWKLLKFQLLAVKLSFRF